MIYESWSCGKTGTEMKTSEWLEVADWVEGRGILIVWICVEFHNFVTFKAHALILINFNQEGFMRRSML
jgi:hypothetical protein